MNITRMHHWDYSKGIALVQFKARGNVIPVKWIRMTLAQAKILMGMKK